MEATLCHVPLRKCLQRGGTKNTTEKNNIIDKRKPCAKALKWKNTWHIPRIAKKANMNAVAITKGINKICTW